MIQQMFSIPHGRFPLNSWQIGLAVVALTVALSEEQLESYERLVTGPTWAYSAALMCMLLVLELFGVFDLSIPFVYFQF